MNAIDHLVYAVADLDAGVRKVEAKLGVPLSPGGSHPGLGTRNRLLRIGAGAYLEVVGPDPDQETPEGGFWLFDGAPRDHLATWAAKAGNLEALASGPGARWLGPVRSMSRERPDGEEISWALTFPVAQLPYAGIVPFFIDWGTTQHPSERLPDVGVELVSLQATHPDPADVSAALASLDVDVVVTEGRPALEAILRTPSGVEVTLA